MMLIDTVASPLVSTTLLIISVPVSLIVESYRIHHFGALAGN